MSYPFGQSKMETTYSENIQKGKFYNGIPKTKLEKLSWTVQKSAYISLVRSILVYSAIIWDPYYIQDINKLESMQKQAARFITGDFKSHDEGCVTKMIHDLGLESLQELRSFNRLVFFYKVVEGLVPPIPPEEFLQLTRQKRQIRAKTYTSFVTSNIMRTAIQWNHLENSVVHAETVEGFKSALHKCY